MGTMIEAIDVSGVLVDAHWDTDDELCIDLGAYSAYLNREDVEVLRDHLTAMLEIEKEIA